MTRLASPWALLLLLALLPLLWIWWRTRQHPPAVIYSDLGTLGTLPATWRVRLRHLPRILRIAFFILAALALARPQSGIRSEEITTFGVDIVIVLDRSGSMRALDLTPDRFKVAKRTVREFVLSRPSDRMGLIPFAGEAYTASPLTLDHGAVLAQLDSIDFARREEDGTAIGLGLAAAVNRLRVSDAKSRVVILVTDGVNNAGPIAPLTAAELAADRGIRIYTIGVGTHGMARIPREDAFGRQRIVSFPVEIDEDTLKEVARLTEGQYYRADSNESLKEIFATIDSLETTEIVSEIHVAWSDRFEGLLLAAGIAFLLELLASFFLRRLP